MMVINNYVAQASLFMQNLCEERLSNFEKTQARKKGQIKASTQLCFGYSLVTVSDAVVTTSTGALVLDKIFFCRNSSSSSLREARNFWKVGVVCSMILGGSVGVFSLPNESPSRYM